MIALFFVLLVSLSIAAFFLSSFLWSVRDGQFEDKEGASIRMLFDDEEKMSAKGKSRQSTPNS